MREIPLSQGQVAIVDDEDYEWLSQFRWHHKRGYALRSVKKHQITRKVFMHRFIMNQPSGNGFDVDHINGNTLDNRRENLRVCTHRDNQRNQRVQQRPKSSRYKGVYRDKRTGRWVARIYVSGEHIHLKSFLTEDEAAQAYNDAAPKYFGEFARLNIIEQEEA